MNAELKALDVQIASRAKELESNTLKDYERLAIMKKLVNLLQQQNELLKQKTDKIIRNEQYS